MDILKTIANANALMQQGATESAEKVLDKAIIEARRLIAERDELRAYKEAAETQKPTHIIDWEYDDDPYDMESCGDLIIHQLNGAEYPAGTPLYAKPVPADKPEVAVPDGALAMLNQIIAELEGGFVSCQRCGDQAETANLDCMYDLKKLRNLLAAAPSHSQQSAESDIEIVQTALDKTGLELRVGKDWVLVCGEDEYSSDDALEVYYKDWAALLTWAKQAVTDRCPSHESEQGG